MIIDYLLLFGAGLLGGVLNAVAGGGSFITFPALMWGGVAPISANATNTLASCAGYLSGAWAFRHDIKNHLSQLPLLIGVSLVGGALGAWLLLQTPEAVFRDAIPWLLLLATVLFIVGKPLNSALRQRVKANRHAYSASVLLCLLLLAASIYGGFFNAGLGIVILSCLALAGYSNINAMNGLKLVISSSISITAIVIFIYQGAIVWPQGVAVLLGTLVGGYLAAHLSRQLPEPLIRRTVIVISSTITVYYFVTVYGR
jgi:uncharacterized membrane protein YfcA